ncbi:DNA (cytosine-5-)-methyltransferase [Talaromyces islandicus]|uniref:DNA (cytosine-5-)-methyltransferase n=1 Tax=Talaromyces islandicus TaxID=28573 RepID=A0A0U1LSE6_TALIS|nr:DNA (cytosine-5-)-methyltransferase [Talaromyces islandicus]
MHPDNRSSKHHRHLHYHSQASIVNILPQNIILRDNVSQQAGNTVDLTNDSDGSHTEAGSVYGDETFETLDNEVDQDDYMDDDEFERFLENWSAEQSVRASTPIEQPPALQLTEYNGLTAGMGVELLENDFLRIKEILVYGNGEVTLRGPYFQKLNDLPTVFPKREGELCWLTREEADGSVYIEKEVSISQVQDVLDIHMTNVPWAETIYFPCNSWVCRFVWRATQDKGEWIIRYLTVDESDGVHRVSSSVLRQRWRGHTTAYGSAQRSARRLSPSEIQEMADSPRLQRQYTFGDAFCGAGGVSVGAWKAGLRVKYGIDFDERACETYRTNFAHSYCYYADFNSWIALQDDEFRVDISHGSPPCQTFSPAHTRSYNTQRDEENSSLIFTACDMIKKVKPRIHTMEETFGLATRHKETFYAVLQGILECGYSVHSKIVACEKYGIPQTRRRLVVIAAGPGEKLPQFPAPTHGPGLQPYVTIAQAIRGIPRNAPDHSLFGTAFQNGLTKPPYDENTQAKTITTGGGEKNYHPSGLRRFTIRELARLQTFPDQYPFSSAYAKKQIGNAVPPRLAEAMYRAAIQSLQETDERESVMPIVID